MLLTRIPKFRKQQHLAIAQTANQLSLTQLSTQGSGVELVRRKNPSLATPRTEQFTKYCINSIFLLEGIPQEAKQPWQDEYGSCIP